MSIDTLVPVSDPTGPAHLSSPSNVVARLDGLAHLVAEATGSKCVQITVRTADGKTVSGGSPVAAGDSAPTRSVTALSDGRHVTMRLDSLGMADGRFVDMVARAAVMLADEDRCGEPSKDSVLRQMTSALVSAVGRSLIIQDADGREVTGIDEAPECRRVVGRASEHRAEDMCRTWPVSWRGDQVGRMWLGPGNALSATDLIFLGTARAVLGAVLAA